MLKYIIPSKTRRKILKLFFLNEDKSFYLRQVVRKIKEEVNAVKRELDILTKAKLLQREKRLNKVFYTLNKRNVYYEDFLRIFAKEDTLVQEIYKSKVKLGRVKFVAMSFQYIKHKEIRDDEIYILFVGKIVVPEVAKIVTEAEKSFGREINYTVMTEDELIFRKKNNDPFLLSFLKKPKILIIGLEEELMK